MPEYLSVVLTFFLLTVGLSILWVSFWLSLFLTNRMTTKD